MRGSAVLRQESMAWATQKGHSLPIHVSIPLAETERNMLRQIHAIYVIQCEVFGMSGEARRSFEEFEALHAHLSRIATTELPEMPPADWSFGWSDSPKLVEDRRLQLEVLLQAVVSDSALLNDGEERLLRFLEMPKSAAVAVRFVGAPEHSRGKWLRSLYETTEEPDSYMPLHDPLVESALLGCLQRGADGERSLSSTSKLVDLKVACELLTRLLRSGGALPPKQAECAENDCSPKHAGAYRAGVVRSLLLYACSEQRLIALSSKGSSGPGDSGERADAGALVQPSSSLVAAASQLAAAARTALLTIARGNRAAWIRTLDAFLAEDGAQRLADAVVRDTSYDNSAVSDVERLVAELLLRGFDGPVARRFAESDLAPQRRRLLNRLFECRDAFVKVAVGLLLAQLVRQDAFEEAPETSKAQAGLKALRAEVAARVAELRDVDIVLLLLEEDMWNWLTQLVGSLRPSVSGFAMLVIAQLVQPSAALIMKTDGFHETLLLRLGALEDPAVRGMAARLLITSSQGRNSSESAPFLDVDEVELGCAVAASVEAKLTQDDAEYKHMSATADEGRGWCETVHGLERFVDDLRVKAGDIHAEALVWSDELKSAVGALKSSGEARALAQEALMEQQARLSECCEHVSEMESGAAAASDEACGASFASARASLRVMEEDISTHERWLDETLQARLRLTKELAERDEQARSFHVTHVAAAEAEAEAAMAEGSRGLEEARAEQCLAEHGAMLCSIEALRAQAIECDDRLRDVSEQLPAWRAQYASERRRVDEMSEWRASVLNTWANTLDAQETCQARLQANSAVLRTSGNALHAERARRRKLREAVQAMASSLQALDGHLGALEQWDSREFTGAPYLTPPVER